MVWVKFHEEITKGAKRGIPRAIRFVLMELSLLCRPERGSVALPLGMSDVNGVCDLLGGNRREVAEALRTFVADGTIVLEGDEGARTLRIVHWATWNAGTVESPGASTQRSREHRAKATATGTQRPLHDVATVGQRSGNDEATIGLQEIREEERRDQRHTQRVHEAEPTDPAALEVLAALRAAPALAEVATVQAAEMVAGRLLTAPKPLPHVLQAIADLARDAAAAAVSGTPWGPEHMTKMLARYTDRARPPHDDRRPARGALRAVQPAADRQWTPPEGAGF